MSFIDSEFQLTNYKYLNKLIELLLQWLVVYDNISLEKQININKGGKVKMLKDKLIEFGNGEISEVKETNVFKIGKKQDDKNIKKSFPLYVDTLVQKELDKIAKKTGYSRNELINLMIQHCLDNLEFTD